MASNKQALLRSLPSVQAVLDHEEVREWMAGLPRSSVVKAVQSAIETVRADVLAGKRAAPIEIADLLEMAEANLVERTTPSLRPVINATGIVLHTGLGRAPLCAAAIEAVVEGASGYCNLEFVLETGARGRRVSHVVDLLRQITGAAGALVVNNNAAATLLILKTFAEGREAVVSRGQLIEIGGSYRLPDIMSASGARLREVGTTNRTRIGDYENALNDDTALLMRVHTSNFRVVGFVEETPLEALVELAHRYGLIAVDDLGSGALFDLAVLGLPHEPFVGQSLKAGADLVCFSGDKLLGGPQCGIIVGKRELIKRLEASPLMRTYRVGKLTLLALQATLRQYLDFADSLTTMPSLTMLSVSPDELADRARGLSESLQAALPDESFYVCSDVAYAGGGSLPARSLQTVVVQWRPARHSPESVAAALRVADAPVVVRVNNDAICHDLRTIREDDLEPLVTSIATTMLKVEAQAAGD
jgi:L-seryl-tRNA(Ser) seleniumtransferase